MSDSPKSSHVPGQFVGYSLQTTECLRQLLMALPGGSVSVEVIDDVGTVGSEGSVTAIQTKSALASNPIADRSVEWWKAMSSWVAHLEAHPEHQSCMSFHLHVFSPKKGPIAESFAGALTEAAALQAFDAAKLLLWGNAPDYPLKATLPSTAGPHINKVLSADPALVSSLIQRFTLSFGSGCSRDDIKQLVLTKFVPNELVEHFVDQCAGWVKGRIETAIQSGTVPAILVSDFLQEMTSFLRRLQFANLLTDFAGEPCPADVQGHALKTYVDQLRIIDASDEEILIAINCFLRAATNRSRWSEMFLVHEDSFDDYEKALQAFWSNTRKQQDLDHSGEPSAKRGLRLLLECLSHRRKLEGKDVPDDFTAGSFMHSQTSSSLDGTQTTRPNWLRKGRHGATRSRSKGSPESGVLWHPPLGVFPGVLRLSLYT